MAEVGKTLWVHLAQPLLKAGGPPEQGALDHVQEAFENLQRKRIYILSWQPSPDVCHSHSKQFPYIQELPVFQLVPVASYPITGNHWKEFGLSSFQWNTLLFEQFKKDEYAFKLNSMLLPAEIWFAFIEDVQGRISACLFCIILYVHFSTRASWL